MLNFFLLIFEIIIIGFMIVFMHAIRKQIGYGVLYIFVGALQFFQTLLVSNVYDNSFLGFRFSPGSTVFYTSTLFVIFLTYYSENILKTRGLIYGLVISNIAITLFSHFILVHTQTDASNSSVFLEELLNFELSLFLVGTSLLYFECILIIFLFQFVHNKWSKLHFYLKLLLVLSITCLFDAIAFYSLFYSSKENYLDLMIGNIVGKQITVIILSVIFYFYISKFIGPKQKKFTNFKNTIKLFSF